MRRSFHQILAWLQGGSLRLLGLAVLVLLAWGTIAPVGTLVWWLKQGEESINPKKRQNLGARKAGQLPPIAAPTKTQPINCYIVFLPGIGDFSANQLSPGEEWVLQQLVTRHPNCVAIPNIFPYSVANKDLTGERLLTPLWRFAEQGKGWLKNADVLVKVRNLWRFAISADDRYGPIYNRGIAAAIEERIQATNPNPAQRPHIILLGTSGGVQVALGATTYLDRWTPARLTVVSVGGTFDGENGFDQVDRVYHLHGQQDWIEDLAQITFASRWPWTAGSPFNRAKRQGHYTVLSSGPHAHDGEAGYFGLAKAPSGKTYAAITFEALNQLPIWSGQE